MSNYNATAKSIKEKVNSDIFSSSTDFLKSINGHTLTPMMEQYISIKKQYSDCLLFYRLGDFYELFFDDAKKAAATLNIVLTKRGKHNEDSIPMCGVPYHSYQSYLSRLIKAGFKVAICEQVESADEAKKRSGKALVKREVLRVVTSGTLIEDEMLETQGFNFLCAVIKAKKSEATLTIASTDISTGEFILETVDYVDILNALSRIDAKEILLDEALLSDAKLGKALNPLANIITRIPTNTLDPSNALPYMQKVFGVKALDAYGDFSKDEWLAASVLFHYINLVHKGKSLRIKAPKRINGMSIMEIDYATRINLELNKSQKGSYKGSLLSCINNTLTAQGSRLLSMYLNNPLVSKSAIDNRLTCVEFFKNNLREDVRGILKEFGDLERALNRIVMTDFPSPRDVALIGKGLSLFKELQELLSKFSLPRVLAVFDLPVLACDKLRELISTAFVDELPVLARDGEFIRKDFDNKLDELRNIKANTSTILDRLQAKYIELTGVNNLKIRQNNIVGYYIEVSSINSAKLDRSVFFQKQTMVNKFRFTTQELSEIESQVNSAKEQTLKREMEVYKAIVEQVRYNNSTLSLTCDFISRVDLFTSLAHLAHSRGYVKPNIIAQGKVLELKAARHPVIEDTMSSSLFIPNDCIMGEETYLSLLTGPNMAGKSTYLRQCAIMIILAQMGSFVPASAFTLSLVDKLFSRIGASDDLAGGRSTFMVEMVETASIVNLATERSFIILDEVGRGTSTYDGMSIAWAVLEHLHNETKARCLFATHYHELTSLKDTLPHLKCYTLATKEWDGKISFLYKLIEGEVNKSYGIHVAELAGMPKPIVKRANAILTTLEKK